MPAGEQTTTTQSTFDPAAQGARGQLGGFFDQIFGTQGTPGVRGFGGFGGTAGTPGTPGIGLDALRELFGGFGGAPNPLQQQAVGQLGQFLNQQSPELQVFNQAQGDLSNILSGTGSADIAGAISPVFQQNLQSGLAGLQAQAPGRFNSAFLQQGTDLAQRSTNDFNLLAAQLQQQTLSNQLQGFNTLGVLGQAAGQNPFSRLLQAGQLGQQQSQFEGAQQNQMQQFILGLLGQFGGPTGSTQRQSGGGGGIGSFLGGLGGFGLGSFGGPLLAGLGGRIGSNLFKKPEATGE